MSKHLNIVLIFLFWLVSVTTWAAGGNKGPIVSLTSPVSGATFSSPANIVVTASATDSNGVARVDFYQGTTLIGGSSTAPYTMTWNNVTGGTYSLKAIAVDTLGASTTSTAVSITVTGAKIFISSPANGSTLYGGGAATVSGTFTGDETSTILVGNGTSSRLATINTNTYSASVPVFIGANTLTVSVARTDKTSDKASITVTGNDSPKIAFRSPATAIFNAPANLLFDVDVVSPGRAISKVEFYKNGILSSTVNSPPYQYTLSNALAQSYTIQAKATDSVGYVSYASAMVTGQGPNILPNISLTSPLNGAVYPAPGNLTLTVNASDPDGSIVMVQYYQNGVLLVITNVSPYSFNWLNVPAGAYTLTARATDNRDGVTTSAPVTITVTPPNTPPTVSLTSPASGASYYAPAFIALNANAADSDGTIAKVDFYQGALLLGTATSAPYAYNWINVTAGSYTITAKATDNLGAATTSSPVNITVNPNTPPTVSLTSPTAGFNAYAPATVTLSANAADSDGTVAKVGFYQGTTLIGTATAAPYTYTWAGVAAGAYTITAVATDNLGAATTSSPVTITVNAVQVAFITPAAGAALTGTSIQVSGTYQGPPNSGITVNGAVATLNANNNFYAIVPLIAGSNTITATITTPTGTTATQAETVTSDGVAPAIKISVDNAEGIAPFTANFSISGSGNPSGSLSVSGGTVTATSSGNTTSVTFPSPGTYTVTISATDSLGNAVTQSYIIVAQDVAQMDAKFKALWNGMNNALIAGDKATALSNLSAPAQAKYGPVFDALMPTYAQVIASWSSPIKSNITSEIGEYGVTSTENGVNQLFLIYFLKGADGVWRLDAM